MNNKNKELVLTLAEYKYADYLLKTRATEDTILKSISEGVTFKNKDRNILVYLLKESSEEVSTALEEMEIDNPALMNSRELAVQVAARGTELEKILEESLSTKAGKKNERYIKHQIEVVKRQLNQIESIGDGVALYKTIAITILTYLKIAVAIIALILGVGLTAHFVIAAFGFSVTSILTIGLIAFVSYIMARLTSKIAIAQKVISLSTKRELTPSEKKKIIKTMDKIVLDTKKRLKSK